MTDVRVAKDSHFRFETTADRSSFSIQCLGMGLFYEYMSQELLSLVPWFL